MASLSFKLDFSEVVGSFGRLGESLEREAHEFMRDVGFASAAASQALPEGPPDSYYNRTGNLRRTKRGETPSGSLQGDNLQVRVIAPMRYASFLNDGTRYIRARKFMQKGYDNAHYAIESLFRDTVARMRWD